MYLLWNMTKNVPYLIYLVRNERLQVELISIKVLRHMGHVKTCSIAVMRKKLKFFPKILRQNH